MVTFLCTVFNRSILTHNICHVLAKMFQKHFYPHSKCNFGETNTYVIHSQEFNHIFNISPACEWDHTLSHCTPLGGVYFAVYLQRTNWSFVTCLQYYPSSGEKLTQQWKGLDNCRGAVCPFLFQSALLRCSERYSFLCHRARIQVMNSRKNMWSEMSSGER